LVEAYRLLIWNLWSDSTWYLLQQSDRKE